MSDEDEKPEKSGFDHERFDRLPVLANPKRLTFDGLSITGLQDFVLGCREIRIPVSMLNDEHKKLFKYATYGEDSWKRIHLVIHASLRKPFPPDWNNPVTYLRECDGVGASKLSLIIFAATGQLPPSRILCGIKFLADVLIPGEYIVPKVGSEVGPEVKCTGSVIVPCQVYLNYVIAWNKEYPREYADPKEVIEVMGNNLAMVRDEHGVIHWLGEHEAVVGEAAIRVLADAECTWNTPIPPPSSDFKYTDEQEAAINGILQSTRLVCCLTGAGGTGKTTVLRRIVQGFNRTGARVVGMAPTGAAVARMNTQIGDLMPKGGTGTVHRYIYAFGATNAHLDELMTASVIIIDEASMLDSRTLGKLIKKLGECRERNGQHLSIPKIIFCGDSSQLPPVGTGEAFVDLVFGQVCPVFSLTKVLRTSDQKYLNFYDAIRRGMWSDPRQAFNVRNVAGGDDLAPQLERLVKELHDEHGMEWWRDTAVIVFRNAIAERVNALCYAHLTGRDFNMARLNNRDETGVDRPDILHWNAKGCRVMFTANDSELGVVNGDVGLVIGSLEKRGRMYTNVELDIGTIVVVPEKYSSVKLGWARTVHKAQGSEYKRVWYIHENWKETRKLVYTAITRAREELNVLMVNAYKFILNDDPMRESAMKLGPTPVASLTKLFIDSTKATMWSPVEPTSLGRFTARDEDEDCQVPMFDDQDPDVLDLPF